MLSRIVDRLLNLLTPNVWVVFAKSSGDQLINEALVWRTLEGAREIRRRFDQQYGARNVYMCKRRIGELPTHLEEKWHGKANADTG